MVDESCWPRDSQVLRYVKAKRDYEKVPLAEIRHGDEVMVVDPKTREVRREKIIHVYDHAKEKQASD